jgi:hypothetical protein
MIESSVSAVTVERDLQDRRVFAMAGAPVSATDTLPSPSMRPATR